MVVLHYKKGDANQFLMNMPAQTPVEEMVKMVCESKFKSTLFNNSLIFHSNLNSNFFYFLVNNLRLKVDRAAMGLEDLAAKGPLKPEGLRGLDEAGYDDYLKGEDITVTDGLKMMPPKVGVRFVKDEHHYRTGWILAEEISQQMLAQAMKMKELVHKSSVDNKRYLSKEMLWEQIDYVRGLVMMAYPGFHGLGEWEPIWVILENQEEFDDKMDHTDDLDAEKTTLWAVNKEL
jgi:hypothetical protein